MSVEDIDMKDPDDPSNNSSMRPSLSSNQIAQTKAHRGTNSIQEIPSDSREILKAKRRLKSPDSKSIKLIFILDTNILVQYHSELKKMIASLQASIKSIRFIIPLLVIQELDVLKRDKKTNQSTIRSVNTLMDHPSVQSDSNWLEEFPVPVVQRTEETIDVLEMNNDDRILKKSLIIKKLSELPKNNVILITNDLNLRNKAIATGLISWSWESFNKCPKNGTLTPLLEIKSPERKQFSSHQAKCSTGVSRPSSSAPARMHHGPNSTSQINGSPGLLLKKKKISDNANEDNTKFQRSCLDIIRTFIIKHLKEIYGDELWDKIFTINFENCTLRQLVDVLKRGWIGAFSDIFNRNDKVQKLISSLLEELDSSESSPKALELKNSLVKMIETYEQERILAKSPGERLARSKNVPLKRKAREKGSECDSESKKMHIDPIRVFI
ncbi:swt1 RNA endoribonuclease [Brevipalpus obovatus]|uniref:swt1 RNA endoribonuclease n=1 Tax=Brevipalpus obovatus TaxID=246614 RepID=UPI003D9E0AFD